MTDSTQTAQLGPCLSADQLALVQELLQSHLPDRDVRVFGSRATGQRLKPWSDLDLVVMGDTPAPARVLQALAQAFDDSSLPFRVDLLHWCEAPEALRQAISNTAQPLVAPSTVAA